LQSLPVDEVDVQVLKQAGVIGTQVRYVKVFKSGDLSRKVSLKGIGATVGARASIEAAGGSIA
jgi:large subunit ribosomal protein L15